MVVLFTQSNKNNVHNLWLSYYILWFADFYELNKLIREQSLSDEFCCITLLFFVRLEAFIKDIENKHIFLFEMNVFFFWKVIGFV